MTINKYKALRKIMGGGEDQKEGRQWGLPYPLFHNLVLGVILCPQSVRALGSDCV